MTMEQDEPIERGPWQRLLQAGDTGPPELTDARIRAEARRALTPRTTHWWLPASLAASFLLAVLLVQWQFGNDRTPATIHEADVAAPLVTPRSAGDAAAEPDDRAKSGVAVPEAPAARRDDAVPAAPPPSGELVEFAPPPEAARKREPPAAAIMESPTTAITASEPSSRAASPAPARAEAQRSLGMLGGLADSAAGPRDPADWYAEIERLRAEGQLEEADAEQARLEAAWPGWLEKNQPQER